VTELGPVQKKEFQGAFMKEKRMGGEVAEGKKLFRPYIMAEKKLWGPWKKGVMMGEQVISSCRMKKFRSLPSERK